RPFDKLGRLRPTPSTRTFASETAVGQQAKSGFYRVDPTVSRGLVLERNNRPKPCFRVKFQAGYGVALRSAGQSIHVGAAAHTGAKRPRISVRQKAAAQSINRPLILIRHFAR